MDSAFDYIVAASAYVFVYESDELTFPEDEAAFQKSFQEFYRKEIDKDIARRILLELSNLGLIAVRHEKYAGTIISFKQGDFDQRYVELAESGYAKFIRPGDNANEIYRRTLNNNDFWRDLADEYQGIDAQPDPNIPASDRVVTLSHNSEQGKLIIGALDRISDDLQTNNQIADEAGQDRDRLVAEAKAAKELIKGDRISISKLRTMIWSFFKEISDKFREKAAEWSVDEVLAVLAKILEMLK
jgi:hypothetical protein